MRFIKYWLPVIIYASIIFCISSVPGDDIPDLFPEQNIIFHFGEYLIFAFLVKRAVREYYPKKTNKKQFLLAVAIALAYAVFDEFHQSFIPNRSASVFDIVVDSFGIFLGGLIYR